MEETKLDWKEDGLSWTDFQAFPDPSSPFSANTSSGISYSWSLRSSPAGREFDHEVKSFFIPQKSWVKNVSSSANLLIHEQLHFDITELHARKLRKAMQAFDFENAGNLKAELEQLYKKTEKERAVMQLKFDKETRHSINTAAQLEWQILVKQELKKLKDFAS